MKKSDYLNEEQKLSQLMDGEWQGLNSTECVAAICADDTLRAKWARYHIIRDAMNSETVEANFSLTSRICAAIDDEPAYSNITPFSGSAFDAAPRATQSISTQVDLTQDSMMSSHSEHSDVTNLGDTPDAISENQSTKQSSFFGSAVGGFALAASVALVTVVGMNLFEQQGAADVSAVASVDVTAPGAEAGNAAFVQSDTVSSLPVVEFVANTGSYWVSPESSERVADEERLNMMLSRHIENSPTSSRSGLLPYSGLVGYEENSSGR